MFRVSRFLQVRLLSCGVGLFIGFSATAQTLDPESAATALLASNAGPTVTALARQNALTLSPVDQIPAAFDYPSVDFSVLFDRNTHILTADGMRVLRAMAATVKDPRLQRDTFQVASHIAAGADPVSATRLTALRAQAVVDHLVAFYGVQLGRLVPVGYGGTRPTDAINPASPANDRIEIINLMMAR